MSNVLYDKGREHFGNADIDWIGSTIKAILVDILSVNKYTVNLAIHEKLSDVPALARIAIATLGSCTNVAGVMDAENTTFPTVSGVVCGAIVLYQDSGDGENNLLIAYIDDAIGLPVTPGGGDIIIQWANTDNKIFKL